MTDYLVQLQQVIKTPRKNQAKALLAKLRQQTDTQKQQAIEFLALTPDKTGVALLRHLLVRETDETILGLLLHTIGKFRHKEMVNDVVEFLFYGNAMLKTEAIRALVKIGTPTALRGLKKVAETGKCDRDILEAIAALKPALPDSPASVMDPGKSPQNNDGFEKNLTCLGSRYLEKRFQAVRYFSTHGTLVADALAASCGTHDHDLLICLLCLVSRTGSQDAVKDVLALVSKPGIGNNIKFAAYDALGAFYTLTSTEAAIKGMTDPAPHVRMAAVKVLEKNCSDSIIARIRNTIESGITTGESLVQTILDVRAKKLTYALVNTDTFFYAASNYLEKTDSEPVLDTFIRVLENRNRRSSAKKYRQIRNKKAGQPRKTIVVLSLSQPFLDVCTRQIFAGGFKALACNSPHDAFEAVFSQKPAAVLCDLFFHNTTGTDFSKEVRQLYGKKDLPIIISSLYKNLDKDEMNAAIKKSGVTAFSNFPVDAGTIKSWVKTP